MRNKQPTQPRLSIKDLDEVAANRLVDTLALEIMKVSQGVNAIRAGELSDRALIVLLHDCTRLNKETIKDVLDGIASLEQIYIKKAEA